MNPQMSQDEIHSLAQKDTPQAVEVPKSTAGLVMWAIGRFGSGAVIAIAAGYAAVRIYTDMQLQTASQLADQKAQNAQVVEMIRNQMTSQSEVATALKEIGRQLESNTRAIEDAHRRAIEGR